MTEIREAPSMEAVPRDLVAAVEVHELRKEFRVPDRKKGRFGRKARVALDGVSFTLERGETRCDPRPERLREVDARSAPLDTPATGRRHRP